jgi:hypothetical protein
MAVYHSFVFGLVGGQSPFGVQVEHEHMLDFKGQGVGVIRHGKIRVRQRQTSTILRRKC